MSGGAFAWLLLLLPLPDIVRRGRTTHSSSASAAHIQARARGAKTRKLRRGPS
jgi:hypothetical protein